LLPEIQRFSVRFSVRAAKAFSIFWVDKEQ
jgi:hypothetical protein